MKNERLAVYSKGPALHQLSIIIPTYNENRTVQQIVAHVQAVKFQIPYEIIIVDDASIDRTYEKEILIRLRNRQNNQNIRLFKNKLNRGKGFSVRKGIKRSKGDFIIVQDADTEYDPHDIPRLLEPILKGEADAVFGSRFLKARRPEGMAFPNWAANKLITQVGNLLYGLHLTDMYTCYKVFRADDLKGLKLYSDRFALDAEITALLARKRVKIIELPINYRGRTAKEGKKIKAYDFFAVIFTLIQSLFVKLDSQIPFGKREPLSS